MALRSDLGFYHSCYFRCLSYIKKENKEMPYMIKCWIPVDADEPQIYEEEEEAGLDYEQVVFMQPENKYEVVECDEAGQEV